MSGWEQVVLGFDSTFIPVMLTFIFWELQKLNRRKR